VAVPGDAGLQVDLVKVPDAVKFVTLSLKESVGSLIGPIIPPLDIA
jgi:hypothetical protein